MDRLEYTVRSGFSGLIDEARKGEPGAAVAAIRGRAAQRANRETLVRRTIAALALTLALGGVSLTAAHHSTTSVNVPQPVASSTPAPAFT